MKGVHFAIDSELANVSLVAVAVNRISLHLGLDETSAGELELCISEAVTNAIRHAYHDEPGHTVEIQLAFRAGQLRLEVSDCGTLMPEEQVRRLRDGPLSLELESDDRSSISEGGRGLTIIHQLMDEVFYDEVGNHNRIIMIKHLATPQVE